MPFNDKNEYEPSNEFQINLKKCLSKYLYPNYCSQEEYKEMLSLLLKVEVGFYEEDTVSNDDQNLTFEQTRDKKVETMKQYAFPKILTTLHQFQQKQNKYSSNEKNQDWMKYEIRENKIVNMIWKLWIYERQHRPRAGIILLYLNALSSTEVLLTKYNRNNNIVYGYAKGKIEFGETIWNCAAREAAEELGLDFDIVYDQIKNSLPIKKNVYLPADKSSIEHYYFIIPVLNKNIGLTPNEQEISGVQWHGVFILPCCNTCQIKQAIQSTDSFRELCYFMVMCVERYRCNSLVQDILLYMDKINGNQNAFQQYENIHRLCRRN